ncbi:hypothetical protein [Oscillatoria salina]|uniref:hypothetical protein n=1 Tax=Oscillatoria salina TaxID=331517 RepID=UPI0013B96EB3|nr:hypothetical protein [Oscillatoria salina]MBZ8179339.1 hypothetical protein [Oscillatoria salina IIICB1]NET87627.1 hypothetical protein [Kamptonema sp. SIO1D9]
MNYTQLFLCFLGFLQHLNFFSAEDCSSLTIICWDGDFPIASIALNSQKRTGDGYADLAVRCLRVVSACSFTSYLVSDKLTFLKLSQVGLEFPA